ncbi:3928_t:CDS:2 [Dentiscutata erythropus]|uniref:3928_t:CDS:1 n=1 Tax=Dentiscutata erythropus TaxID=1348616 RepID=A0A9N9ISS9_9GLOM|nr:3928_t:CDS:2 [Dentiscutata erythropus]
MPIPPENTSNIEDTLNQLIHKERLYNITELEDELCQNLPLLNENQYTIFNAVIRAIEYFLQQIGDEKYPVIASTKNKIELPLDIVISSERLLDLINFTYPNFTQNSTDMNYLIERAILTPKNDNATTISDLIID